MNYTEHYHLPQWVESDRIMMDDFNQMCADIDEAVSAAQNTANTALAKLPYVVGNYTGDGTTTGRTVTLGFRPQLVIISGIYRSSSSTGEPLTRFAVISAIGSATLGSLTDSGFTVHNSGFPYPNLNADGSNYNYIAFQ